MGGVIDHSQSEALERHLGEVQQGMWTSHLVWTLLIVDSHVILVQVPDYLEIKKILFPILGVFQNILNGNFQHS